VGLRDCCFLLLLLDTGLRLSEGLGLKVGDVDLEEMSVKVLGKATRSAGWASRPVCWSNSSPICASDRWPSQRSGFLRRVGLPQ